MPGEKELNKLLKTLQPIHNPGEYTFCVVKDPAPFVKEVLMLFKEQEGYTVIIKKELADSLNLEYSFITSWITLTVHSSLEAVGLTAAFSSALSKEGISCNVVAAYYHDHIFIDQKDTEKAMGILNRLSAG